LIVRELLSGSRRFADIQRGVPRISRNLLCQRLDTLSHIGIIERKPLPHGRGSEYHLTEAGREFGPVIEALGTWGFKWSSRDLRDEHLDPDFLMWVLHKLVRRENLPVHRVVVFFQFRQVPKRRYWLILSRPEVDVCLFDPGFGIDLEVIADLRALADICLGHLRFGDAVSRGWLRLLGTRNVCKDFSKWVGTTHFGSSPAHQNSISASTTRVGRVPLPDAR
jgi:DNA-binding HxlR family transcriptional regulator